MKPRYSQVKPGEKIYMLSCAYEDSVSTIHEGRIYKKYGMDILIQRDMTTHKGGCSGSPVIDTNGYLIGIISGSSGSSVGNVSVAISTEYLKAVLDKKPGLNEPRKDYGLMIYQTVLEQGVTAAIKKYRNLINDPENYYIYNLRSPNRNGLRETGEKLIMLSRYKDAVAILKLNVNANSNFYENFNLLAKAELAAGNKAGAIAAYKESIKSYKGKENAAHSELKALEEN